MKKIFIFFLSCFLCFSVFADATLDDLLDELQAISQEQSTISGILTGNFLPNIEEGATQNIYDLLWYALDSYYTYPSIQEVIANFDSSFHDFFDFLFPEYFSQLIQKLDDQFTNVDDWLSSIFYHLSDNWQDISNGFLQNHTDLLDIRNAILDLEQKFEGYLQGFSTGIDSMNDSLTTMIDIFENQVGGSNAELPKFSLIVNTLTQYGKDVDINSLPSASVDTDGKFYSDMIKLTKFVAETEGSINNAALSILTNVQIIATVLSEKVQEDEVDEAIEDYRKDADSTKQISDRLQQEDVQSFFGFDNTVSQVQRGLQVQSAPQGELISEFFVTDKFYYSINNEEFSIDPVEYQISDESKDLIKYGRMIVQFIYWCLTFLIAFFIFKWVYNLMYTFLTALGS